MRASLQRRVEELEASSGTGDYECGLRNLAARFRQDPLQLARAAKGHEKELKTQLSADGSITWEGFKFLFAREAV